MRFAWVAILLLVPTGRPTSADSVPGCLSPGGPVIQWTPQGCADLPVPPGSNVILMPPATPWSPVDGMPVLGQGADPDPACCRLGAAAVGPLMVWRFNSPRLPGGPAVQDLRVRLGYVLCQGSVLTKAVVGAESRR